MFYPLQQVCPYLSKIIIFPKFLSFQKSVSFQNFQKKVTFPKFPQILIFSKVSKNSYLSKNVLKIIFILDLKLDF